MQGMSAELKRIEEEVGDTWLKSDTYNVDAADNEEHCFVILPPIQLYLDLSRGRYMTLLNGDIASRFLQLTGTRSTIPILFQADKIQEVANGFRTGRASEYIRGVASRVVPSSSDDAAAKLSNVEFWFQNFPNRLREALCKFGMNVDWRRSIMASGHDPYFNRFMEWHCEKLRESEKFVFSKGFKITTPDNSVCKPQDRATGENLSPMLSYCFKFELIRSNDELQRLLDRNVRKANRALKISFICASARAELIYGVTNLWVLPDAEFGVYQVNENEAFVCSKHCALNLAHQGQMVERSNPVPLLTLRGSDFIGCEVQSPLREAIQSRLFVLPLLLPFLLNFTGTLMSCPGETQHDYDMLRQLKRSVVREHHSLNDEWTAIQPISISKNPNFSEVTSIDEDESSIDLEDLAELHSSWGQLHEPSALGVMAVGEFADYTFEEARPLIIRMMDACGGAFSYADTVDEVVARSGDVCVVSKQESWMVNYRDEKWFRQTLKSANALSVHSKEARNVVDNGMYTLGESKASDRITGTRLPWDRSFAVSPFMEFSLAHLYSSVAPVIAAQGIAPEQLSDGIWDHVFLGKQKPADTAIDEAVLQRMRSEFELWNVYKLYSLPLSDCGTYMPVALFNYVALFPNVR